MKKRQGNAVVRDKEDKVLDLCAKALLKTVKRKKLVSLSERDKAILEQVMKT